MHLPYDLLHLIGEGGLALRATIHSVVRTTTRRTVGGQFDALHLEPEIELCGSPYILHSHVQVVLSPFVDFPGFSNLLKSHAEDT